jgi:hypothetical protein
MLQRGSGQLSASDLLWFRLGKERRALFRFELD